LDKDASTNDRSVDGSSDMGVSRDFVRLLTTNQHKIYAYILTLVSDWDVADDVLQDTCEVMWSKYAQERPIKNFGSWAIQIAYNKVLNYYAKKGREHVLFSSAMLDDVAARAEDVSGQIGERVHALRHCLTKLSEHDQRLLRLRYEYGNTIKDIAQQLGRPIHGMYKTMARIHDALTRCVRRRLAPEGWL
jgi:RNA polymerase sigma-70 factor (ECF subfamily)